MISSVTTERLFAWQRGILFLDVLLFPIQTILFFRSHLLAGFHFSVRFLQCLCYLDKWFLLLV